LEYNLPNIDHCPLCNRFLYVITFEKFCYCLKGSVDVFQNLIIIRKANMAIYIYREAIRIERAIDGIKYIDRTEVKTDFNTLDIFQLKDIIKDSLDLEIFE
jgi:hypothetical protein